MASVHDVAAFVLEQCGTITAYKLHKLLYYSQGWSLAWDGKRLFDEKIKAYKNGPCVGILFNEHRGVRNLTRWSQGDSSRLLDDDRETIRAVLNMYGAKSAAELVDMTHQEQPWIDAWTGDQTQAHEITTEAMRDFFEKLAAKKPRPSREAADMQKRLRAFMTPSD
jgi:uncharacterized phage-associated protein